MCGRELCTRVCAHSRLPRAPSPRPLSPPCLLPPLLPRPALPPSPRNQCSCCRAGCGFLQSLPRPPLRPEQARSPAQQRPSVLSCEPRPQPRTAPRSRLPAHPPGRRGAGGGRDPGAPTPYPREVGRGPEAGRCQLTEAASWAAGGRPGGGARAQAGRTPLPCRCPAAALRPGSGVGAGRLQSPGGGGAESLGLKCLQVLGFCGGRGSRPRGEAAADQRCAPRQPSLILSAGPPIPLPVSAAESLQLDAAAPGAGVGAEWAAARVYFRVPLF